MLGLATAPDSDIAKPREIGSSFSGISSAGRVRDGNSLSESEDDRRAYLVEDL